MELVSGLRFAVVGAGRSGIALTRFLLDRGAEVLLTDARSEGLAPEVAELGQRGAQLQLGGHDEGSLTGVDRVLVSPGVPTAAPALEAARRAGVVIWGEIEFAFRFLRGKVIGITGTNGKSTTTRLTGQILSEGGLEAVACGNLGPPLIDAVRTDTPGRHYVVELSSFQLETIESFRPDVAVLLNVSPDHQDRYPDHGAYCAAKGRLFENQRERDWAVLNRDDADTFALADKLKSRVALFSREVSVENGSGVASNRVVVRRGGIAREVIPLSQLPLFGVHNLENVLAAATAADLCGVATDSMAETIRRFQSLPHRLERVAEVDGIPFYDDSKATNVAATFKSLESFPGEVVLILGGKDKGGAFGDLAELIRDRCSAVVLMGQDRDRIHRQIGDPVPVKKVDTMEEAVAAAHKLAPPKGTVLLAPGCASFDAYRNFEERGEDFKARVQRLLDRKSGKKGHP